MTCKSNAEVIYPPFIQWRSLNKKRIDYLSIIHALLKNILFTMKGRPSDILSYHTYEVK